MMSRNGASFSASVLSARLGACCVLLCLPIHAAARGEIADDAPSTHGPRQARSDRSQPEFDLLTFHRTNYFASGFTKETQVKFQFSIKYDLWPNRAGHNLYFAYTQKSLWDLWKASSPFRENNYNPELFYLFRHQPFDGAFAGCRLVSEQMGIDHESNGSGASASRSWNRVFAATSAECRDEERRFVGWGAKLWLPFGTSDNSDITDYAGYGEVQLRFGAANDKRWWGTGEVVLTGRKGTGTNGSVQAELIWRPSLSAKFTELVRFAPYLFAQAFSGQGETLLRYDRTDHSVRIGLALRDQPFE